MKLYKIIKISAIASCLAIASQASLSADYSRAEKELRIMSKIFETSISESTGKTRQRFFNHSSRKIESTYLAKQGMVFTFSFNHSSFGGSNDWQAFGEGLGNLMGTISAEVVHSLSNINVEPPVEPRAPRFPRSNHDWEDDVDVYEEYQEAMEHIRDEQRDKREEVRDIQRSIRDLERRERREEVDKSKLDKAKAILKNKMQSLNQNMLEYEKKIKQYRAKKITQVKLSNKNKSDLIVSTLCDYGATLRSLENGEHVTLVFSNYENKKDQIYVFNYKDVKSCSNKDKLIKNAISYQI